MSKYKLYVGTSGWLYDWNEEATLDWYIRESGLNAVELNASFYRFPFRNQVKSWARKGKSIRWAIKVHRSITHLRRLSTGSFDIWTRFRDLFKEMEDIIDFYLFQLPPSYKCKQENLDRIAEFYSQSRLSHRMAVEFRHDSCFNNSVVEWASNIGLTVVSIDAPIATWIVSSNNIVYLRMHGRESWYGHEYKDYELREIANKIRELSPSSIYVFFNNDHWMLENARSMKRLLEAVLG